MTTFEQWEALLPKGHIPNIKEVFNAGKRAGMSDAMEIAKNCIESTGCKNYDRYREIGALDASIAIQTKAEE
jgi:hypothetical protein